MFKLRRGWYASDEHTRHVSGRGLLFTTDRNRKRWSHERHQHRWRVYASSSDWSRLKTRVERKFNLRDIKFREYETSCCSSRSFNILFPSEWFAENAPKGKFEIHSRFPSLFVWSKPLMWMVNRQPTQVHDPLGRQKKTFRWGAQRRKK